MVFFGGCLHQSNGEDNRPLVSYDTSDAKNTFEVLTKYPKPMTDSLYRTLFISLFKEDKCRLIEQHLIEYQKISGKSKIHGAVTNLFTGFVLCDKSEYDSAIQYVDKALRFFTIDQYPNEYLVALRIKAICYSSKGIYDLAIQLRYQTIQLCENKNDTIGEYVELGELGIAFLMNKDYNKASKLIESSLQYFQVNKDEVYEAYFLSAKSVVLYLNNAFDSAIVVAKKSLDLRIKNDDVDGQAESYNNLALAYMGKGDWRRAKDFLQQSINLYLLDDKEGQIPIILQNLATCYDRLNMSDSALAKIHESYEISRRKGLLEEEMSAIQMLSEFYKKRGDCKKSFDYYRQFNMLEDSLFSSKKQKVIQGLSMKYETSKKEEKIKLLEKDRQIQMQNKWMLVGLLVASVLIGGVLLLLLMFRNRKNKEIFKSKEKLRQSELTQVKNELDFNKKELEGFMLNFIEKTKLISELEAKLDVLSENSEGRFPNIDKNISELTQMKILTEDNWAQFKIHFEKAYPGLIQHVKESYESLSPAELRMFLLMKLNIDSKEIASILGISIESVKKTRYRLKKKMELKEEDDLNDFVRNY